MQGVILLSQPKGFKIPKICRGYILQTAIKEPDKPDSDIKLYNYKYMIINQDITIYIL